MTWKFCCIMQCFHVLHDNILFEAQLLNVIHNTHCFAEIIRTLMQIMIITVAIFFVWLKCFTNRRHPE